jgi:hypothetical protein
MHLIHTTDEDNIYQILKNGKLMSSSKTKNVRMYGQPEGSKYIYLRLGKPGDFGNIVLDNTLLLDNVFYLQTGWSGEPVTQKIDGRKLTLNELNELLDNFNKEVNKWRKRNKFNPMIMMSNEILVKNNISLKKYLLRINITENNKIIKYAKKHYPDVNIMH